jgi:hydrogenase maturation protease
LTGNKKSEILILGLGNPILHDDSVGLRVVDKLEKILNKKNNVDFYKVATSGIEILDIISGYKRLILIDVIKTGKDKIGTLTQHKIADFNNSVHLTNPHQLNLPSVIEFANKTGIPVPEIIDIFTIEVEDIYTFSLECSPEIKTQIPEIAKEILKKSGLK